MTSFCCVRTQKLKSFGVIGAVGQHNNRQRLTINADPTKENRYLVGAPTDDVAAKVKEKIGPQKVRKNAVLAVEVLLTTSPEYFRPEAPAEAGTFDKERTNRWAEAAEKWLWSQYGERLVSAVLHLDEATPHIQAIFVPLDGTGKLNCRALQSKRAQMQALQTSFATQLAPLGISRGVEGSTADHRTVKDFYRQVKSAFIEMPKVKTLAPVMPVEPAKPGFFAGKAERDAYEIYEKDHEKALNQRTQRDKEKNAVNENAKKLVKTYAAQAQLSQMRAEENKALRDDLDKIRGISKALKLENSLLKNNLRDQSEKLRQTNLADVLMHMYGATEAAGSRPVYASRKFELPGRGSSIAITSDKWIDNLSGEGGRGAINLVMYLENFGQERFKDAVRLLGEIFGTGRLAVDVVSHAAAGAAPLVDELMQKPPPLPEPQENTWSRAKRYLIDVRKIPDQLVYWAHKRGIIYSDERANLVFVRDDKNGCFKRGSYDPTTKNADGTRKAAFKQTLGKDGKPFLLHGTDGDLYITEGPIDALSLKSMFPDSTVMATGGNFRIEALTPYLDKANCILLAQNNDSAGREQVARLESSYTPRRGVDMLRRSPTMYKTDAKDFNEALQANQFLSQFQLDENGDVQQKPELKSTKSPRPEP